MISLSATKLKERIFTIKEGQFSELAMDIFIHQSVNNKVYSEYLELLGRKPSFITSPEQIPFLPIELFKERKVITGETHAPMIFVSSGTTGTERSKHYVNDISAYEKSFREGFELFFGSPSQYCILALLPSYLERNNSSLVYMTERLIEKSNHPLSGFFLNDFDELVGRLKTLEEQKQKILLLGVSYSLLDLADKYSLNLHHTIVMETGGMKGRRKEMTREELHTQLEKAFGVTTIHSEYGMTELLSQAYSKGEGKFQCPPWMKVLVRDVNDPFQLLPAGQTGALNIIDLANLNSCSFIATSDLGKVNEDARLPDGQGSFEVLGRMDSSDVRGCNLLIE